MTTKVSLIADGAVNSGSIFNGTINSEDLNSTAGEQAVTTNNIRDNAVTTSKINFETALVPLGGIIMWSGTTTPVGWQLCNGTDLPSTSPLRPGITNTPNLQDRFIVGAGSGYAVGNTGGENTVQLTEGQLASHAHGIGGDGNHNHLVVTAVEDAGGDRNTRLVDNGGLPHIVRIGNPSSGDNFKYSLRGTASAPNAGRSTDAGAHSHGGATVAAGSNQSHENRPPYYALAFIMKVL